MTSLINLSHTSRGTEARSAYRRTSSEAAASARCAAGRCTSGHKQLSSYPRRRAAVQRWDRCGTRPGLIHRSAVLESTPQQRARSSVVIPVRIIAVRSRSFTRPIQRPRFGTFQDPAGTFPVRETSRKVSRGAVGASRPRAVD